MARINLRPWREERKAQLQKRFIGNLVAAAILGAVTLLGISHYYDIQMDRQQARNSYLKKEITSLDAKIAEIQELRHKRERLLERLGAIQELQGTRPVIVRNFDELVRVLPDGLYYKSLKRSGERISIEGMAEVNNDVSTLMRNLQGSIWFGEPNLSRVAATDGMRGFSLTVPLERPKAEETGK